MKIPIQIMMISTILVSCQPLSPLELSQSSAIKSVSVIAKSPRCQSFNFGDNLQPQLGTNSLQLNLPVARFNNSLQGRSVVLLPVTDSTIRVFWVRQDSEGKWSIAQKQTVIQLKSGILDASQMHRLYYNAEQQKVVLFITLPSANWEKGITIQPILEETESRWGRINPFHTRLFGQGFIHPFQGIDQHLSGKILSENFLKIMNQIDSGSIYVPRVYSQKITVLKSNLVNRYLCPLTGSK